MVEISPKLMESLVIAAKIEKNFADGLNLGDEDGSIILRAEINLNTGLFDTLIETEQGFVEYRAYDNYKRIDANSVSGLTGETLQRTLYVTEIASIQAFKDSHCPILEKIILLDGKTAKEAEIVILKRWIKMYVSHHKNLKVLLKGSPFKSAIEYIDSLELDDLSALV